MSGIVQWLGENWQTIAGSTGGTTAIVGVVQLGRAWLRNRAKQKLVDTEANVEKHQHELEHDVKVAPWFRDRLDKVEALIEDERAKNEAERVKAAAAIQECTESHKKTADRAAECEARSKRQEHETLMLRGAVDKLSTDNTAFHGEVAQLRAAQARLRQHVRQHGIDVDDTGQFVLEPDGPKPR